MQPYCDNPALVVRMDRSIAGVEAADAAVALDSSVGCNRGGWLAFAKRLLYTSTIFFWMLLLASSEAVAGHYDRILATGSNSALTEWGRRYENGEGVQADVSRAIRLYCKAAKRGHADAQYYLGRVYASGRGADRDDALAAAWFKRAAGKNHRQSRNLLRLLRVKPKAVATCPVGGASPKFTAKGSTVFTTPAHFEKLVRTLAPEYRLDPALVLALIRVESNFDARARSPKNAQGLMQLIPETAERFGVRDVWDPEENLRGGMAYLRWLLDHFSGDVKLALAGYNAGEGAVQRHRGIPPYAETQEYVRKITGLIAR